MNVVDTLDELIYSRTDLPESFIEELRALYKKAKAEEREHERDIEELERENHLLEDKIDDLTQDVKDAEHELDNYDCSCCDDKDSEIAALEDEIHDLRAELRELQEPIPENPER